MLKCYIAYNEKRITNPDLFTPTPLSTLESASPLHWNQDAVDLKELLTALDESNAFTDAGHRRIPFKETFEIFEKIFHISLGNPVEAKRRIVDRKKEPTAYLNRLISCINALRNARN